MNTEVERLIRFQGSCTFELKDSLHHPKFWWPQTLLTYRIDFSADAVSADRLALFDCSTNEQVPFQLSAIEKDRQGNLAAANVHFMASLGSGEQRSFQLRQEQRRTFPPSIRVTKAEQSIWVDNGRFAAQLPDSQLYPVQVPGPIMQVSSGANRYGNSKIDLGALRILEIVTECREMGDLFATFAVTYHFDGGKRYEALLTFTDQMDFVHFAETSERISEQDNASFQLYWSGLAPTHRHAPNNPAILDGDCDTPYDQLNWCKIDEMNVGGVNHPIGMWSNGKDGEIPFRLSLYEPQASIVKINAAAFWNETTGQSVGAFIVDEAKWDNGRYDLFCSWDGFAVRFYYNNGLMGWKYPLITGTRTTAIAVYAHEQDIRYFEQIRSKQQEEPGTKPKMHGASYCVFLQNRYSLLSLNKVKDFVLEYPDEAKRNVIEAKEGSFPDAESFEAFMMSYSLVDSLPEFGQRENAGFSPVPYRRMVRFSTAYGQFKDTMPAPMRKRIEAMLLLLTYLAASEEVVPLLRMLGGPPNLLGDIKRSLGYTAALFPEHPEAERWKELFAKFVETSLRLYTRPELPGLRLSGGRWAENLGTYTWAFLIPALHTAIVLEKHTGMRNLFTGPYAAMVGRWLVHSMTAPFDGENEATMQRNGKNNHFWGCFPQGFGPHRVYLPIGAHAARRTTPSSMREFAKRLERYDPLLAEQIHYVCSDLPDDFEARSKTLSKGIRDDERTILGTRPEFATTAFTGFGVMLRNGVYTDKEVSVFVQQIDEGPNYRWGTAGAGGNGNIYYYANGKAYSHNGKEDAGDRRLNDCEVGCNFGVWKNNKYTSIGQNIMKNAYHALGAFQFTAIESERDSLSYSYPEYEERNVLLSGTDYISIFDKTGTPAIRNRFIWSVSSFDQMPAIHLLTDYDFSSKLTTESDTGSIDSVWFEGRGSCFAVVSHRDDLLVEKRSYGAIVSTDAFKDTLFRSSRKLKGEFDGVYFEGTAAAIRESAGGQIDVALLQGHRLTGKGVSLRSESGKTGISISQSPDGRLSGFVSGLQQD
ncbi:MAG: hypothetical protein K0Q59_3135, partial [Paenibacillus sp.]|nr:hypothetical protein [Paenibacillus sp.]